MLNRKQYKTRKLKRQEICIKKMEGYLKGPGVVNIIVKKQIGNEKTWIDIKEKIKGNTNFLRDLNKTWFSKNVLEELEKIEREVESEIEIMYINKNFVNRIGIVEWRKKEIELEWWKKIIERIMESSKKLQTILIK